MTALRNITVPYILTCAITGLAKNYTSKEFVQRKIDNYGGDEAAMIKGYVSRDAKREIKALGLEVDKITEDHLAKIIKHLNGTATPKEALKALHSGNLFLTKKVKVNRKAGAGKKKATKKGAKKSGSTTAKKARPSRSKAAVAARKAAKVAAMEAAPTPETVNA